MDNVLLDLLNSSYPTKAEFINCEIIIMIMIMIINYETNSLQCRRILGGRKLVNRIATMKLPSLDYLWFHDRGRLGRVEIVTLTVGVRAKKEERGGEGEKKNTPARYHCSFGKLRTLANGALACSAGVFWVGESLLIVSLRWSRHLWFYDRGRLGRIEIVTLTAPPPSPWLAPFPPLFGSFNMALSRLKRLHSRLWN